MYEPSPTFTSIDIARLAEAIPCRGGGPDWILHRASTDSTNIWARREIGQRPLPFVCMTDHQTAGRGRHGRTWLDSHGASVLMSIVIEAPPLESRSVAPLIAGEATARAIDETVPNVRTALKWPNDILIGGRKVGGLLIESVSTADDAALIIGIGVNVDQELFEPGMRLDPTSLRLASGTQIDRPRLVAGVITEILKAFNDLQSWTRRMDSYVARMHNLGGTARLDTGSSVVTGTIRGVASDGALLLETSNGIESFHAGDVSSY